MVAKLDQFIKMGAMRISTGSYWTQTVCLKILNMTNRIELNRIQYMSVL